MNGLKIPLTIIGIVVTAIIGLLWNYNSLAQSSQATVDAQQTAIISDIKATAVNHQKEDNVNIQRIEGEISDIKAAIAGLEATMRIQNDYFKRAFGLK